MSDSRFPSIFARIETTLPTQSAPIQIESQAKNSFSAVKKLFERLEQHCTEEDYEDLRKRFLNALKSNDYRKFDRGFQRTFYGADEDPLP